MEWPPYDADYPDDNEETRIPAGYLYINGVDPPEESSGSDFPSSSGGFSEPSSSASGSSEPSSGYGSSKI